MSKERKATVLAYGEVTGHKHAFYANEEGDLALLEEDGTLKILQDNSGLVHEEHTKHDFDIGIGKATTQREYSMGSLRKVTD